LSSIDAVLHVQARSDHSDAPVPRAFAAVRPPGHHVTRCRSAGNGILNNVALGALYAWQRHRARVLIVDLDIHLSGGTSDIVQHVATAETKTVAPCSLEDFTRAHRTCEGPETASPILLVDVFGARGQDVLARARQEVFPGHLSGVYIFVRRGGAGKCVNRSTTLSRSMFRSCTHARATRSIYPTLSPGNLSALPSPTLPTSS
jgi:hypothetical protein